MKKRMISLMLAAVMGISLLAGCGDKAAEEVKEDKGNAAEEVAEETAKEADSTETEKEEIKEEIKEEKEEDIINLKWYVANNGPNADTATVLEHVNEYLIEKIGCTLEIVETDFGSFDQKMQMVISSGEEWDICFTSTWCNNYYTNVAKNAYLELDDLLEEYGQGIKEMFPDEYLQAMRVDGKLYGIFNNQILACPAGPVVVKEYIDKYNFDVSTVKTTADLEPLLAQIKADNPSMYPVSMTTNAELTRKGVDWVGVDPTGMVCVRADDDELKCFNYLEEPATLDAYKLAYDWMQKGYIRPDAATITDVVVDLENGAYAVRPLVGLKPSAYDEEVVKFGGRDVVCIECYDAILQTGNFVSTMQAISRTSKHPEKAMEFLNLLNTDAHLYNMLTQGIEGIHWEKVDDTYIRPIADSGYAPNNDWAYGNQFLAYIKEGQDPDVWEETEEMNRSTIPATCLGFVFNMEPVQNEIAAVSAVMDEYLPGLRAGAVDPEVVLPEFLEKLETAGSQKIIDEAQKQINEWAKTK